MQQFLESYFAIRERNSSLRTEVIAGFTTFLAMVYSVIVVPGMLGNVGFDPASVFLATCLVSGVGSLLLGGWARLPMAIGCAISLTAFVAFSLVLGQGLDIETALGAVFVMGVVFTLVSLSGLRQLIMDSFPLGIAHGTGIGIGLFLFLIAANSIELVVSNESGLPVRFGELATLPVISTIIGLALVLALEARRVTGSILIVIVSLSIFGLLFDANVKFQGFFALPAFASEQSHFFKLDIKASIQPAMIPVVIALVMTSMFDATGTIRAVADQAKLVDDNGQIENGNQAFLSDSISSAFSGLLGSAPAAVYIESAAGTAAGGRTGLSACVVGVLFLLIMFLAPLSYLVPAYATAPALMYVGLLMLSNVRKLDFDDSVDAMSGLTCAVAIVFSANIVTGMTVGFSTYMLGRIFSGEWSRLGVGVSLVTVALVIFYLGGWAIQ